MSIQNSLNSVVTSVAGAAIAYKHGKDKQAQQEEQGMLAKAQYHEAGAKLAELQGKGPEVDAELEAASEAYDKLMKKPESTSVQGKKVQAAWRQKALTRKEAAERAFSSLQDEISGTLAMRARAEMIMKRTKVGGVK